jgi:hypothetical protein
MDIINLKLALPLATATSKGVLALAMTLWLLVGQITPTAGTHGTAVWGWLFDSLDDRNDSFRPHREKERARKEDQTAEEAMMVYFEHLPFYCGAVDEEIKIHGS